MGPRHLGIRWSYLWAPNGSTLASSKFIQGSKLANKRNNFARLRGKFFRLSKKTFLLKFIYTKTTYVSFRFPKVNSSAEKFPVFFQSETKEEASLLTSSKTPGMFYQTRKSSMTIEARTLALKFCMVTAEIQTSSHLKWMWKPYQELLIVKILGRFPQTRC